MTDNPLRLLLAFDDRLQRDRDQPAQFLHRRDRRFALDCQQQGLTPDVRRWLTHLEKLSGPGREPDNTPAARYLRRWRVLSLGFIAAGALLGVMTMLGLLFYEGGQRINVTVFLAFVLLQLVLALMTTVQAAAGWQPWHWLTRRWQPGNTIIRHRLQPALAARAAQAGGLAFASTGLLTLLIMVVIQDLAFGWSTTLDTASTSYHRLVSTIATPWAWFWPAAAPSPELVEATRFFRAAAQTHAEAPQRWGQWWPFLAMTWLVWTWLPRLVLLVISQLLLQNRARRLLTTHPGLTTWQYRMETPVVDTGNAHNDAPDLPDTQPRNRFSDLPANPVCIAWAGAGGQQLPAGVLPGGDNQLLPAGGNARLEDDEATLHAAQAQLQEKHPPQVLVITRSWQPPTGELADFLEQARRLWPEGTRVTLLPLAPDPEKAPPDHLLQPWLRFAGRLSGFAMVARAPAVTGAGEDKP